MTDPLNELITTAVRGTARAGYAWMDAVNSIVLAALDSADVESGKPGFNETVLSIPVQPAGTKVKPGRFADLDDEELPAGAISIEPGTLTGQETELCVRVDPPAGTASGTYQGSLWDSSGKECIAEYVGVYVIGDRPPGS